jgi:hypothetical protein
MANTANMEPFSSEINGNIQLRDFLKTFRRTMQHLSITTDTEQIKNFMDYLKSDSPAEEWYTDEGSNEKSWRAFKVKFLVRFLGAEAAKKTAPELEREMLEMRLVLQGPVL